MVSNIFFIVHCKNIFFIHMGKSMNIRKEGEDTNKTKMFLAWGSVTTCVVDFWEDERHQSQIQIMLSFFGAPNFLIYFVSPSLMYALKHKNIFIIFSETIVETLSLPFTFQHTYLAICPTMLSQYKIILETQDSVL